jgi:hypothetical protein
VKEFYVVRFQNGVYLGSRYFTSDKFEKAQFFDRKSNAKAAINYFNSRYRGRAGEPYSTLTGMKHDILKFTIEEYKGEVV